MGAATKGADREEGKTISGKDVDRAGGGRGVVENGAMT